MKKFFSFFVKLLSAIALLGVVFYGVGYFLYMKTKTLTSFISKTDKNNEE